MRVPPAEMLVELLERGRLAPEEVASRFDKAIDPAYWEKLNPDLTVCRRRDADVAEAAALDPQTRSGVRQRLAIEGYFQVRPLLAQALVEPMRACVEVLREEHWLPVFSFVYDQFWQATRSPSLVKLLSELLGPGYRQDSRIWCFDVSTVAGSRGFSPHIDGFGRTQRLTVWIPLTDATLENGCMYVIPRHLVPPSVGDFCRLKSIGLIELCDLLQGARALPAPAGSILGWDSELIHWSSLCSGASHRRISLSVEFLAGESSPKPDELPLLDGCALPSFPQRLYAIGKGILDYRTFEPQLIRYEELGKKLMQACAVGDRSH